MSCEDDVSTLKWLIISGVQEEHSSAITVDLKSVQTNIVLLNCDNIRVDAKKLCQRLASVSVCVCVCYTSFS